jgi:hypothetical protein
MELRCIFLASLQAQSAVTFRTLVSFLNFTGIPMRKHHENIPAEGNK